MITVLPMYICMYYFSVCYMELSLEMSGCIMIKFMNCLIKTSSEFDWFCIRQGAVNVIVKFYGICQIMHTRTSVVQNDDKQ